MCFWFIICYLKKEMIDFLICMFFIHRLWPQYVRDRVRNTYLYFGSSLIVTAAAAVATLRVPVLRRFFAQDSLVVCILVKHYVMAIFSKLLF